MSHAQPEASPDNTANPTDRNDSAALPEHGREERVARAAAPPGHRSGPVQALRRIRETTLASITDAKANATLRSLAAFICKVSLEYSVHWPDEPEGHVRHYSRAVVADLRYLQGALVMLSELRESRITRLCVRLSPRVKKIADALEKALDAQEDEE